MTGPKVIANRDRPLPAERSTSGRTIGCLTMPVLRRTIPPQSCKWLGRGMDPVLAYIDVGSGSLIIQAAIAALVAAACCSRNLLSTRCYPRARALAAADLGTPVRRPPATGWWPARAASAPSAARSSRSMRTPGCGAVARNPWRHPLLCLGLPARVVGRLRDNAHEETLVAVPADAPADADPSPSSRSCIDTRWSPRTR